MASAGSDMYHFCHFMGQTSPMTTEVGGACVCKCAEMSSSSYKELSDSCRVRVSHGTYVFVYGHMCSKHCIHMEIPWGFPFYSGSGGEDRSERIYIPRNPSLRISFGSWWRDGLCVNSQRIIARHCIQLCTWTGCAGSEKACEMFCRIMS